MRQVATDESGPDLLAAVSVQQGGHYDVVQLSLSDRRRWIKDVPGNTAHLPAPADGHATRSHYRQQCVLRVGCRHIVIMIIAGSNLTEGEGRIIGPVGRDFPAHPDHTAKRVMYIGVFAWSALDIATGDQQ